MSVLGPSRPNRASDNSGHVRYAAESGSKFVARVRLIRNEPIKNRAAPR